MRSAPADPTTDVLLDWVQEGQSLLEQAVLAIPYIVTILCDSFLGVERENLFAG